LIAATTTVTGLRVELDPRESGVKVADDAIEQVRLRPARFRSGWNYIVLPGTRRAH
jgi:hypothetical protein